MKNIEGGTFLIEANKKVPEKIIKTEQEARLFVEQNRKSKSFLLDLAREHNPEFQKSVVEVPPILIYGTVDPVGNVSELLTMMSMAKKIDVPIVLILDDVCHDLRSCSERIMKPSFDMVGMRGRRLDEEIRFDVPAYQVLPGELMDMLMSFGFAEFGTLAEAYEVSLYLLVEEFFGEKAFACLAVLRTSEIFGKDSVLGQVSLELLRKKVTEVGVEMAKEKLVFLHVGGEKIYSNDSRFDEFNLGQLYGAGGSLGGTAHVSLTTMLLDKEIFGDYTHPLILAEKDTASGANFATVYEKLLVGNEQGKIAVSGIRRIKASKLQSGGDGIDPLVLLSILKTKNEGVVIRKLIEESVEDAFLFGEKVTREKELILSEPALIKTGKISLLKEKMGVDGSLLISMGIDRRVIGSTLLVLAEMMLAGNLKDKNQISEIIKRI